MKKIIFCMRIVCFLLCSLTTVAQQDTKKNTMHIDAKWIDHNLQDAANQYKYLMGKVPDGVMPRTFRNDSLLTCAPSNWVAGYYPGTLVYLYENAKDKVLYNELLKRVKFLDNEQYDTSKHDIGLMMYCSYGNLNRITPTDEYKKILINSARSLAKRFNPAVGCIRSWGNVNDTTSFKVIIDNMMCLEILFWAAKETGDRSLYDIAVAHANTTMQNHFRRDNSSYHLVIYNPLTGKVVHRQTAQGAADESAWARGQAWGLYGYTTLYRETKDKKYLVHAQRIASFILNHPNLPTDKIPYWDFNAPGIPNTYRDASAAAVMASALVELAGYSNKELSQKYIGIAETMLQTLSSAEYKAKVGENGGFILMHSVAHIPIIADADTALSYADYYYAEAMLRYKKYLQL